MKSIYTFLLTICLIINYGTSFSQFSGNWSAMGTGMNNSVYAIAFVGNDVYAGGRFNTAGGVSANRVSKWNGSTWSGLGSGFNFQVDALAVSENKLYAGGTFTNSGGIPFNHIAMWDGIWHPLGTGLGSTVTCLAFSGDTLFAGGNFTSDLDGRGNHVSMWDGTQWKPLIDVTTGVDGLNDDVHAITVSEGNVFVGGTFTIAGGHTANYIAKWDGSNWSPLVSNGVNGVNYYVRALTSNGSDVYVGGEFTQAGGSNINAIAKWNEGWTGFGEGIAGDGFVMALNYSHGKLFAGGQFEQAGSSVAYNIAFYDGTNWFPMQHGLGFGEYHHVYTIAVSGNDVYAGGTFTQFNAYKIAKWTFDTPLPVELSSFTSTVDRNNVTLNWTTSSEINNSRFDIERKNVSQNEWTKVGSVAGYGTTSIPQYYAFTERLTTGKYNYRLKQIDLNGNYEFYELSNEVEIGIKVNYKLSQNYPNPFNPTTKIDYELPDDGNVNIKLYDLTGKELRTILNEGKTAGYYTLEFNAEGLASGVYVYRMEVDGILKDSKQMILLK